jgi:alkylation response protein AidB-like acyl-CoA dehydrogenase
VKLTDRQEAEDVFFSGPQRLGVAKGLFQGKFVADWVVPYPAPPEVANLPEIQQFLDDHLDPAAIDRAAEIPAEVIAGLARLGVLGMAAPVEYGGRGASQLQYCRVMEEIGSRCSSTSIFVNAHHSIGLRALVLFGTPEQKARWLPALAAGREIAAFALTEPEAGSDAGNVQTRAVWNGTHYVLTGEKRYITNAAIAQVLTVMARTDEGITSFLVTPDMPGFTVVEARMEKLGIRGTVTSRLAFHDVPVPPSHVLGEPGHGLKVALTVLDFGRTTFGACCTGAAKTCLRLAAEHARTRRQFGRTLGEFELVKKKLARMSADTYAMEAMTTVTASLIDRGLEDYMLETAMLKVFTTEALWAIVNDAFQIHGGAAYFTDRPLERMLRDARINQIGEGANEVLVSFIALAGMRGPGLQLQELWDALRQPSSLGKAWRLGFERIGSVFAIPTVPFKGPHARTFARSIRQFHVAVERALIQHREDILNRQYVQQRMAGAAVELFASACVLSRIRAEGPSPAAELFLRRSLRRVRRWLGKLGDNDDQLTADVAEAAMRGK